MADTLVHLPITEPGDQGAIATWQLRQAEEFEAAGRNAQISLEAIRRMAGSTSQETAQSLLDHLQKSKTSLEELDSLLKESCKESSKANAPATSPLRNAIEQIQGAVAGLYADRLAAGSATPDEQTAPAEGASETSPNLSGPVRSRQEAFMRLKQVADFFEQMDPQCLLAAHIRRIVRLGNMSVTEYFSEIVEDKNVREQLFKLVGLEPPRQG